MDGAAVQKIHVQHAVPGQFALHADIRLLRIGRREVVADGSWAVDPGRQTLTCSVLVGVACWPWLLSAVFLVRYSNCWLGLSAAVAHRILSKGVEARAAPRPRRVWK